MKIDELKRLCVPVSERLPETEEVTDVIAIYKNKAIVERAYYTVSIGQGYWIFQGAHYSGERPEVSMWLDLKILIKK